MWSNVACIEGLLHDTECVGLSQSAQRRRQRDPLTPCHLLHHSRLLKQPLLSLIERIEELEAPERVNGHFFRTISNHVTRHVGDAATNVRQLTKNRRFLLPTVIVIG